MALKQPFAVKTVHGDDDLELTAKPGESLLVKDIWIHQTNREARARTYATIKIEKTTVGYFRVGGILGNHLYPPRGFAFHSHTLWVKDPVDLGTMKFNQIYRTGTLWGDKDYDFYLASDNKAGNWLKKFLRESDVPCGNQKTLLGWLADKGIFTGFPVAEGETFIIDGIVTDVGWEDCVKIVFYEIYDAGDQKSEDPNGSKSNEYLLVNYGDSGGNIQATADNLHDTPNNPAEFPAFPFGKVVPAAHEIDILGVLASEFAPGDNDGTDYSRTKYLKMVKDRQVLFDEDRNGLPFWIPWTDEAGDIHVFAEGVSLFGNYSSTDKRPPLWFPEPLVMSEGDELNIYTVLDVGGTGQAITPEQQEIALIERVRRVT